MVAATPPGDDTQMESPSLFTGGVVLLSLGATAIPTGVLFMAESENVLESDPAQYQTNGDLLGGGLALAIGGAALAAGGITMMVIGGQDAEPAVALGVTPGGMSLKGSF